eukprot:1472503-Alexandrium_andersonii.AAC.1
MPWFNNRWWKRFELVHQSELSPGWARRSHSDRRDSAGRLRLLIPWPGALMAVLELSVHDRCGSLVADHDRCTRLMSSAECRLLPL